MNTPVPEPPFVQEAPFVQHGSTGAVLRLALGNLLLNIATLSLWRFWGRTRVRRQLWSGTTAWGDPLEYTGTGKELFVGFAMVLVVVFLPLMAAGAGVQALTVAEHSLAPVAAGLFNLTIVVLVAAGFYRARRYQLSRTVWRGIRGGQTGSAWLYAALWLGVMMATGVTFGWAWPWGEMVLARYRMSHTSFGSQAFACEARARGLYPRFAVVWLMAVVFASGVSVVVPALTMFSQVSPELVALAGLVALPAALAWALITLALPWAWYRVGFWRALAAGTRFAGAGFAGAGFAVEMSAWPALRLGFGNMLITILSLGVLRPWANLRSLRFASSAIRVIGRPDFAAIGQSADTGPWAGEGLVAVLDGAGEF